MFWASAFLILYQELGGEKGVMSICLSHWLCVPGHRSVMGDESHLILRAHPGLREAWNIREGFVGALALYPACQVLTEYLPAPCLVPIMSSLVQTSFFVGPTTTSTTHISFSQDRVLLCSSDCPGTYYAISHLLHDPTQS